MLVAANSKFIHSNLALRYLKAYTSDLDYSCDLVEFSINDRAERVVEEIMSKKPDIVAFSCYIWNMEFIERVSVLIKLIDSSVKILLGGPEVTYNSEEVLKSNSSADFVIEGEGEEPYREFVRAQIGGHDLKNIRSLYFKDNNQVYYGGSRQLMDINQLVFPYNEEDNLDNKIVYYEASRGCPFNCKYCLSSTIRGVRFLNVERVKKELKFLVDKKVRLVKFVDRTFNCSSEFAMTIWEYLMSLDTETIFHFEISADILNNKQISLLSKAPNGRFQFEVGVQTTNNEVLKNINRFVAFEHIKKQVIELNKHGNINQHLDLIAGLPGEGFESFKKSFNDLYEIAPNEIQLGFLKVLKGAPMKAEAEQWGIVHSPYAPYEVLRTNDISYEELIMLKRVEEMVDKYYNSNKFSSILKYFIHKFKTPFDFYLELGTFFYNQGYFSRNIASADYYKVFLEFNQNRFREDNKVLSEIIKYDYLKYNRKKWLPEFLLRNINKNLDRDLREAEKKNLISIPFNKYHLEIFNVDIFRFLDTEVINEGNYYLIFDENQANNIIDITDIIMEQKLLN
jgi:radical SAM superfamily enzyme YgiQ (UPF0313 family)